MTAAIPPTTPPIMGDNARGAWVGVVEVEVTMVVGVVIGPNRK